MWVVSLKRLREFWAVHVNAELPLRSWFAQTAVVDWRKFSEVRAIFPNADLVGNCTVFNIGGNNFRLIARLFYRSHKVYVLRVMTHADYSRDDWPTQCGCHSRPPDRTRPVKPRRNALVRRRAASKRGKKS